MLIGHLDEKTRDTVRPSIITVVVMLRSFQIFCAQNISQTLLCVINVLTGGDSVMTTHIAVDLLRKLVVNEVSGGGEGTMMKGNL